MSGIFYWRLGIAAISKSCSSCLDEEGAPALSPLPPLVPVAGDDTPPSILLKLPPLPFLLLLGLLGGVDIHQSAAQTQPCPPHGWTSCPVVSWQLHQQGQHSRPVVMTRLHTQVGGVLLCGEGRGADWSILDS